jgi:hypothetical protein
MLYFYDKDRHLICYPYSIEGLHEMAGKLGINKCWFHKKKKLSHYDIPLFMMEDIDFNAILVSKFTVARIILGLISTQEIREIILKHIREKYHRDRKRDIKKEPRITK